MNTAAHHPQTETPRLPLYLRGQDRTAVDAEGPALAVRRTGKSLTRYPIVRIARIIAGRNVQWSGGALHLCMQEEIPIVLIDGTGTPTGYIQPALIHPSHMDGLLRQWVDLPDWPESLDNWLRAQRMHLVKTWCANRVRNDHEITEEAFRELVRRHVQQPVGRTGDELTRAALAAYAGQKLQEAGIAPRYWGHGGGTLDLRAALITLLEISLALEFASLGHAAQTDAAVRLRILHAFGKTLNDSVLQILGSLHQHIRGQLEEWH